ncbi:MAG: hypothetical protein N4A65_14010 [Cohaesibacter sp.]|jgi:hypothetical protein|nr:hypothetical protein [Cohaesibacter sp.]
MQVTTLIGRLILFCAVFFLGFANHSLKAAEGDISLKLFGQNVLEGYNGCQFALWQTNRNPKKDQYSYLFFAPYNDGEELPGWMKVGKDVLSFSRVDRIRASGQRIEHLRLYETNKSRYRLLIEIKKQHVKGDDILIDKAKLTLIRSGKFPFIANAKGHMSCPQPDHMQSETSDASPAPAPSRTSRSSLPGDAISLGKGREFSGFAKVPKALLTALQQQVPECDPYNTTRYSERYAISNAMSLWLLPCALYARTGTSVFMASLNDQPHHSVALSLPSVPGSGEPAGFEISDARVGRKRAIVSSFHPDAGSNCGSYRRFQLRAVEGEAVEFFLLEKRVRERCDDKDIAPQNFPLVYSAKK